MSNQPDNDDLLWGIHPIIEMLRLQPKKMREVVIQQGKTGTRIQEIIALAQEQGVKVRFLPGERFPSSPDKTHQGVLAKTAPVATCSLHELLKKAGETEHPLIVALDSIQDPHNLGAIIRTAAAAGAIGIILPKDRSAPLNATAAKAAAGAMAWPVTGWQDGERPSTPPGVKVPVLHGWF